MASQLSPEQRFACEERVILSGGIFETASRFLPEHQADLALAFEALFASVNTIPLHSSDPGVAMAKLGWWQQEMAKAVSEGSQHPVVQAVIAVGGMDRLDQNLWTGYIAGVAAGIDAAAPGSARELMDRLEHSAGFEALIMAGIAERDPHSDGVRRAGAGSGLLSLIMELTFAADHSSWLPMDLLARTAIRPPGEGEALAPHDAGQLAAALVETVSSSEQADWASVGEGSGVRYLAIRQALETRWMNRIRKRPQWLFDSRGGRCSATDQLLAWRTSRRFG